LKTVTVQNARFGVNDVGAGSPVLLVHGFPLNHTMWQSQIDHLARSHRVIAPDLRGFGASEVTAGEVSMTQHADDLNGILDALEVDQPVSFCGLSMGGYIAWEFLRRYPQRVGRLVLCDTRAVADTPEAIQGRHALAELLLEQGAVAAVSAMVPKLLSAETREHRPEIVLKLQTMIQETDPEGMAASLRGMAHRRAATDLLEQIELPTLLVVGEFDTLSSPEEMREMAASIRDSRFELIPDAGHMSPMENAEAVNLVLLEFLA
jgi:pimeloyl-ACP methyl ester carboxylesterase